MNRILSMALMCAFIVGEPTGLGAQVAGTASQASGVISGTVSASTTGRTLSGIRMQLADANGRAVGQPVVSSASGDFTFAPIGYGTYTLQCVQRNKVVGTTSVNLKAATESVRITCATDVAAPFWKHAGVLTGLAAAAAAIGAAAIVAGGGVNGGGIVSGGGGDASGSR